MDIVNKILAKTNIMIESQFTAVTSALDYKPIIEFTKEIANDGNFEEIMKSILKEVSALETLPRNHEPNDDLDSIRAGLVAGGIGANMTML